MTQSRDERDGLAELHADVLTDEVMDTSLLLRFAQEPEALDAGERSQVEAYLAASPAHRDELALLVRFAAARGHSGEPEAQDSAGTVVPISSHPRWRSATAAIGMALAASLALALVLGLPDSGGGPVQVAQDAPAPPVEEQLASEEARPPVLPDLAPTPEPVVEEPPPQLAQAEIEIDPSATPEVVEEPVPQLADASTTPSVELQEQLPSPGIPVAEPHIAETEPIVLAMNIAGPLYYGAPAGSTYLEPLGLLRNASADLPSLQALVPDHVARTLSPSPTLYWFVSEDTQRPVEFVLSDSVSIDPMLEITLEPPLRAGIHAVRLADHGVTLEPEQRYQWFVSFSPQHLTRGGIERVAPDVGLQEQIDTSAAGERGQVYAAAGYWYDALDFISTGVERAPDDRRVRELRAGLLEQTGHREAAAFDRAAASGATDE